MTLSKKRLVICAVAVLITGSLFVSSASAFNKGKFDGRSAFARPMATSTLPLFYRKTFSTNPKTLVARRASQESLKAFLTAKRAKR